jgi:hypothetical protein
MRRLWNCVLLCLALIILAIVNLPAAASAGRLDELSTREDVLKWIDGYRNRPDPASVRIAMKVLSQRGVLRDSDAAGVYVGFLAGVIGARPAEAEGLVGKVLPALAEEDQWLMVRAIAYSGLPGWKALLSKFAARMPSRRVMIDKYLDGTLPALEAVPLETAKPALLDKMKYYFASSPPKRSALTFDTSPELLDTLWGSYFATGSYRPVARIIAMLPWSRETDSVEKLTVGGMANEQRDPQPRSPRHAQAREPPPARSGRSDPGRGHRSVRNHGRRPRPQGGARRHRGAQDQRPRLSARNLDLGQGGRRRAGDRLHRGRRRGPSGVRPALRDRRRHLVGRAERLGRAEVVA